MASFVYNPYSNESSSSQWSRYVQQREFTSDITSAIKSQTKAYQTEFRKASEAIHSSIDDAARQQAQAITEAAGLVAGTLEHGFADLTVEMSEINSSITQLGAMTDWRLSEIIDQQRISNLLLENVALLLRIPDVQKERQYHMEQGFKHYKNAVLDADLYEDALENLLEAEKREKTDYVVLHRIGMIYLYAQKFLDLAKAEEYLRRAAKYAVVDSDQSGQRVFNILAGDVRERLSEQYVVPDAIKMIAAESFFQASVSCYAQGKFGDAIELTGKAFSLAPALLEAGFMKAKVLAAEGDESKAVEVLRDVIQAERFYAVKTAAGGDLASKAKVRALLERLRDDAVLQAKDRIERCKAAMIPQSEASITILELERLLGRNSYLDALAALDGLTCERAWNLKRYTGISIEAFIPLENEEAEKEAKRQAEEANRAAEERKRQEQIEHLLSKAKASEERERKKWFSKDYSEAIALYEQAAKLGSKVAKEKATQLMAAKLKNWGIE